MPVHKFISENLDNYIFVFVSGEGLVPEPPHKAQTGGDGGGSNRGLEERRVRRRRRAFLRLRRPNLAH